MNDFLLPMRIGALMLIHSVSPRAGEWLNETPDPERGDVTAQNAIWIAIAAAGAFGIAIILYNKFKTKATNLDMDNPGQLPANP